MAVAVGSLRVVAAPPPGFRDVEPRCDVARDVRGVAVAVAVAAAGGASCAAPAAGCSATRVARLFLTGGAARAVRPSWAWRHGSGTAPGTAGTNHTGRPLATTTPVGVAVEPLPSPSPA